MLRRSFSLVAGTRVGRFLSNGASVVLHEPTAVNVGHSPVVYATAEEALGKLRSNTSVFVHGGVSTPYELTDAMPKVAAAQSLENIEVFHIHTSGDAKYAKDPRFKPRNLFTGGNMRDAIATGHADYVPIFLSDIPHLMRRGGQRVDTAIIQVSPPDAHGYCSLGLSVDIARAAVQCADVIIAQVNPCMPRTLGEGLIHVSNIDSIFNVDRPIPEVLPTVPDAVEERIARFISDNLVEDNATLQTGIGAIPDTVLSYLKSHKGLGVHTEMFSDGVMDLVEAGVVTNAYKASQKGRTCTSFAMGSQKLYKWLNNNPAVVFLDIGYVNETSVASAQPKLTAINSAIEVDLTGQVVSDSIGSRIYSGVGGQVDFMRAAALSQGGKPILALPSRTGKGKARIVPLITQGGGVVTSRAHVHYVVTEYGIAYLHGKSLRERAKALIAIAHPDDRAVLEKHAKEVLHLQ